MQHYWHETARPHCRDAPARFGLYIAGAVTVPTRYQRRTANLPSGAETLSTEERTNIVIDLRDQEESSED